MTSNPGGFVVEGESWKPCALDGRNGFLDNLKQALPARVNCLMVSSYPDNALMNDGMQQLQEAAFAINGLHLDSIVICDERTSGCRIA